MHAAGQCHINEYCIVLDNYLVYITHFIEVVQHPDFGVISLQVILHKVAFHAYVNIFCHFLAVFQRKLIRFLVEQFSIFTQFSMPTISTINIRH